MSDAEPVAAHEARQTHSYWVHFPEHPARASDPHYVDFNAFHRKTRPTARCYIGERIGFGECKDAQGQPCVIDADGQQSGLEVHHSHIEFAVANGVSLTALEVDYPGVSNPDEVGAWIESAENLRWVCVRHHRGEAGAHSVAHADYEAAQYILGLISKQA